jgi:hypothetical protein
VSWFKRGRRETKKDEFGVEKKGGKVVFKSESDV